MVVFSVCCGSTATESAATAYVPVCGARCTCKKWSWELPNSDTFHAGTALPHTAHTTTRPPPTKRNNNEVATLVNYNISTVSSPQFFQVLPIQLPLTQLTHSSVLFNFKLKKMDQKKNTTFKNNTRNIGGQNAIFTTVAGTHNFQLATIVST